MSPKIFLIRHAEKPETPEDKDLSIRGWQRAGALLCFFAPPATPRFLFASHSSSNRPRQTLLPLSEKLGIEINVEYGKGDETRLAAHAKACDGVVVICWQHEYMSAVANAILGDASQAPQQWPKDRFDVAWVFDLDAATGKYRFTQLPQRLLGGDSPQPI